MRATFPLRRSRLASPCGFDATLSPPGDLSYGVASPHFARRDMAVAKSKPAAPPAAGEVPAFDKEQELKAYRDMLLIRRFEEKAGQMYGMGLIGGFCHLYIGQEAVVVG